MHNRITHPQAAPGRAFTRPADLEATQLQSRLLPVPGRSRALAPDLALRRYGTSPVAFDFFLVRGKGEVGSELPRAPSFLGAGPRVM